MKITDILDLDMVVPQLSGDTKPEILRELAGRLTARYPDVSLDRLVSVLAERERLGSTAIGDAIAIPHGKIRDVKKILGVFGRSVEGVDFESLDSRPTQLFFLLVAPEDSTSLHLKALARVSRLFKDPGFRERLIKAADAPELFRLIKEEDSRY